MMHIRIKRIDNLGVAPRFVVNALIGLEVEADYLPNGLWIDYAFVGDGFRLRTLGGYHITQTQICAALDKVGKWVASKWFRSIWSCEGCVTMALSEDEAEFIEHIPEPQSHGIVSIF